MEEKTHHIVYRRDAFTDKKLVYLATAEELAADGWEQGGRRAKVHDDGVLVESTGRKLDEMFDSWRSKENEDACVSVERFPATWKLKVLD